MKKLSTWTRDRNCFAVRYKLDPAKREHFLQVFNALCDFAQPFYERGCAFAFQGWARDPNEFVVMASWDEDVVEELRGTAEYQKYSQDLMDCAVEPVIIEQFAGMDKDRSVFDTYPQGESKVHNAGEIQHFIFR